jgi:hypothetical protein
MAFNPNDYEYRKTTIKPVRGTPTPIAVVTVGVPKRQIAPASGGDSDPFRVVADLSDMRELRDHLSIQSQEVMEEGWQPTTRPAGDPTFEARDGTLFWVERR